MSLEGDFQLDKKFKEIYINFKDILFDFDDHDVLRNNQLVDWTDERLKSAA